MTKYVFNDISNIQQKYENNKLICETELDILLLAKF